MASFSPDGQQFVSASLDRTVKVWDIDARQQPLELRGHSNQVWSLAFSRRGDRIITSGADRTARLWDPTSSRELFRLKSQGAIMYSAAFSPDGNRILTGGEDHTGRLWDAANGELLDTFKGHSNPVRSVTFFPNGRKIVTGSSDKTAKVWDVARGKCLLTLTGHTSDIYSVACSPDERQIVTGSLDSTARVWDAATGLCLFSFNGHNGHNSEQLLERLWWCRVHVASAAERGGSAELFDSDAFSVDSIHADPTVDMSTVVSNLESIVLPRFDEMDVLEPFHLAENNVPHVEVIRIGGRHSAQLTRLNLPAHRVPTRAELDCLAFSQFLDVGGGPAHTFYAERKRSGTAHPTRSKWNVSTPAPLPAPALFEIPGLGLRWSKLQDRSIPRLATEGNKVNEEPEDSESSSLPSLTSVSIRPAGP